VVRSTVRAEIANSFAIISFENFRKRELPRMLIDFELAAADFGLAALRTPLADAETTQPDALYGSTDVIHPENEVPLFHKACLLLVQPCHWSGDHWTMRARSSDGCATSLGSTITDSGSGALSSSFSDR